MSPEYASWETPDTIIIPAHPPVTEEMKLYNIQEQPMTGELGEISEWSARMALRDFPVGSEQSLEEVTDRAMNIQFQLHLSKMVDLGLVNMEWSEESEDFTYGLTEDGKEVGSQMFE